MNRTTTMNYQGKNIYLIDFSSLKSENEIKIVIDEAKNHIRMQSPRSLIVLCKINEMHFNNQIKDIFIDFVKGNKPFVKASAVLGVNGLRQILFNGIMKLTGRDVRSFDEEIKAKEWLVLQ